MPLTARMMGFEFLDDRRETKNPLSKIRLNDLPDWSAWPGRLLSLTDWTTAARTIEKTESEYDQDKYAKCLDFYHQSKPGTVTPEELKRFELGEVSRQICVSSGGDLESLTVTEARSWYYSLLAEVMRPVIEKASVVVELGCGYGFNLWMLSALFPEKTFVGGEYSANAVQLAGLLFKEQPQLNVQYFNFYDLKYEFLEKYLSGGPILIFTSHALEQLPSASGVFDVLRGYRKDVIAVFHFEPVYDLYDDSLMGLMRRRYTQINDYNRDLYSSLQSDPEVRIVRSEPNVFGLNPFNPTSIIQWEFN